ncbi:MAG: ABC transporter ATP-binding protein [Corynebacterium sp.]|nr:ABC transporter ATP-binding protein [Corynebacterium sp.]
MVPRISCQGVAKNFGDFTALHEVSFDLQAGRILGVLGSNGAGKSTLINMLAGLSVPSAGTVELCGKDPRKPETRKVLGVVQQHLQLPGILSPRELARYVYTYFAPADQSKAERDAYCQEFLESWDIGEFIDKQLKNLSGGQQRRVSVALAFIGSPEIVLLDEPTTGLDPKARHRMWTAIQEEARKGTAILLTSHYLDEVEYLSDEILLLDRGRRVAHTTKEEFLNTSKATVVRFSLPDAAAAEAFIAGMDPALGQWVRDENTLQISTHRLREILVALLENTVEFEDFQARRWNLEEAMEMRLRDEHQNSD